MRPVICATAVLAVLITLIAFGQAQAPDSIPVQGVLTDAATGEPLDGNFDAVVFSIYDVQSGGNALWSQNVPLTVERGVFSTYLGPVDLALFRDHGQLWLGVQVGDDAEMQRILIGSTPFAAYAEYTDSPPGPEISGEYSVQAGQTDCSAGCTQELELGPWKFCALVGFESRIYDNTGTTYSDINNCRVYTDASNIWQMSAYYHGDGSPQDVGYTRCSARCFN